MSEINFLVFSSYKNGRNGTVKKYFVLKLIFITTTIIIWLLSPLENIMAEINPEKIIEKSIQAQGGRDALESIKDQVKIASFTTYTPRGTFLGERKVYTKYDPPRIRTELTLLGMEIITGFDGQKVWIKRMGKVMEAPESIADSVKASTKRDRLLLNYKEKGCKVEYGGENRVNEQPCYQIKFTDKEGSVTIYYFDVNTYLPVKVEYDAPDQTGKTVKNEVINSDFRPVGALIMPFKTVVFVDKQKTMETVIKEIEINQGLENDLFSMPDKKNQDFSE